MCTNCIHISYTPLEKLSKPKSFPAWFFVQHVFLTHLLAWVPEVPETEILGGPSASKNWQWLSPWSIATSSSRRMRQKWSARDLPLLGLCLHQFPSNTIKVLGGFGCELSTKHYASRPSKATGKPCNSLRSAIVHLEGSWCTSNQKQVHCLDAESSRPRLRGWNTKVSFCWRCMFQDYSHKTCFFNKIFSIKANVPETKNAGCLFYTLFLTVGWLFNSENLGAGTGIHDHLRLLDKVHFVHVHQLQV